MGVVSQRADAAFVLLSLDSGRYYVLEGVAARVWELCDGTRTQGEIARAISDEYSEPLDRVAADLAELVDELDGEKLLAPRG